MLRPSLYNIYNNYTTNNRFIEYVYQNIIVINLKQELSLK